MTTRYPDRWEYTTGGSLGGASGTYRCAVAKGTTSTCTVMNNGSHLVFSGNLDVPPIERHCGRAVEDSVYMYFGWWSRQATGTESRGRFETFHGPSDSRLTRHDNLRCDRYGHLPRAGCGVLRIYEPAKSGSEHGDFSATATLDADFDASLGERDDRQFSGHPDWSLALEQGIIQQRSTKHRSHTRMTPSLGRSAATPNKDANGRVVGGEFLLEPR